MKWIEIKKSIVEDLNSRNLKNPSIRLGALENIEAIMKRNFPLYIEKPEELKHVAKEDFKNMLAEKKGYVLNSAEKSIINEIYYRVYEHNFNNMKQYRDLNGVMNVRGHKEETPITPTTDLSTILSVFKTNRFDPLTDNETKIPDKAGNYILCLRSNSKLPRVSIEPTLTIFDGLQVIYTGKASGSLRRRDYREHFGNNAGKSTLRKSLGVLFGYKQVPRDSDPTTGKTKFGTMDEMKLTEWMCANLILYFFPTSDFKKIESQLINHFNPPLNLQGNDNRINKDFRKLLSQLRT